MTTDTTVPNGIKPHKPAGAPQDLQAALDQRKAARDDEKAKEKAMERSLKAVAKTSAAHNAATAAVDKAKSELAAARKRRADADATYEASARAVNG